MLHFTTGVLIEEKMLCTEKTADYSYSFTNDMHTEVTSETISNIAWLQI